MDNTTKTFTIEMPADKAQLLVEMLCDTFTRGAGITPDENPEEIAMEQVKREWNARVTEYQRVKALKQVVVQPVDLEIK